MRPGWLRLVCMARGGSALPKKEDRTTKAQRHQGALVLRPMCSERFNDLSCRAAWLPLRGEDGASGGP